MNLKTKVESITFYFVKKMLNGYILCTLHVQLLGNVYEMELWLLTVKVMEP